MVKGSAKKEVVVNRRGKAITKNKSEIKKTKKAIQKHKKEVEKKTMKKKVNKEKQEENKAHKVQEKIEKDLFDNQEYYNAALDVPECDLKQLEGETLGDMLLEQLREDKPTKNELDEKVELVYKKVGELLSHYTSGKLPKPFTMIPVCENWEDLVELSDPSNWSPQAAYEAVILFTNNLNISQLPKFLKVAIVPKVRENIKEKKKLNVHYYNAIKKSIFKPSAFFKGIIFPFCQQCSAKEAAIIGSILHNMSIPLEHSCAALINMCEFPPTMGCRYFIKILISKNYRLPPQVINALVKHFCKDSQEEKEDNKLPVLWHQTLLIFVKLYKGIRLI